MSPTPTGRIAATSKGVDLVLTRTFLADIEDVWKSVTVSERTALWFGRWEGDAGPGKHITLYMGFEKDAKPSQMLIEACRPPHQLAVATKDAYGEWHLELLLEQTGANTTLTFIHHMTDTGGVGDIGPGWEYYLDMLVASRDGKPLPSFDDYYPAQRDYFLAQIPSQ